MNIYTLPTGYLFTKEYSNGSMETLSIGDYGKHHNVKADFLGLTKEINGVPNTLCMPLSEKWVITVSTQRGCPMKCSFCFTPDTKIKMKNGHEKDISMITLNDEVLSYNTETKNIEPSVVSHLFERDYVGELIELELENGAKLSLTPNHPILIIDSGEEKWISAENLHHNMEIKYIV